MDYSKILSAIADNLINAKSMLARLEKALNEITPGTLYVRNNKGYISFYEYRQRKEKYLKHDSYRLTELLRQRYLEFLLLQIRYQLYPRDVLDSTVQACTDSFSKLLHSIQKASLDIQRITLTDSQYNWVHGTFRQKQIKPDTRIYTSLSGVKMRSKSEVIIGNILELLGIPYRYEAQLRVYVLPLIKQFDKELRSKGLVTGSLFFPKGNYCYWNVPDEFQWMNLPGSIWRSFNYRDGYITIYPDFTIKLADGRLLYIEHEGLAERFDYRCNASERVFLLRQLGIVNQDTMICTFENDIQDEKALVKLFSELILPKVFL